MNYYSGYVAALLLSFIFSVALTPLVRSYAINWKAMAAPREDRWHSSPTPVLGGVAIFLAFSMSLGVIFLWLPSLFNTSKLYALLFGASLMFALGLLDDLYHLSVQTKLIGQVVVALLLVFFGFKIDWFVSYTLNTFVSIFWIVGITNAFNLLDNMDGLAGGIGFISATLLAVIMLFNLGYESADAQILVLALLMGSLLGFLVYNFSPASIFMGDAGSLFIGCVLAGAATHNGLFRSGHLLPIILVPVLLLFIPILDTGFVSVMRTFMGRSVAQGGKDHSSHRLVAIGFSEKRAVLILYAFSLLGGLVALVGALYRYGMFLTCLCVFLLISAFFWTFLAKVRIYPEEEQSLVKRSKVLTMVWVDFTYKRRVFEVIMDVALFSFGYWLCYFLRYEAESYISIFPLFLTTLPIVLVCLMSSNFVFGVYRGVWRYTSLADVVVYIKAITAGVALAALTVALLYDFEQFSRTILVLLWGISIFFLAASRLFFRLMGEVIRRNAMSKGKRVLIYGAGDEGEFTLRAIVNNAKLGLTPVGFIDDDSRNHKRKIRGYKIFGGRERLMDMIPEHGVEEIIVASGAICSDSLKETSAVCQKLGIPLRSMELSMTTWKA